MQIAPRFTESDEDEQFNEAAPEDDDEEVDATLMHESPETRRAPLAENGPTRITFAFLGCRKQ